MRTSTVSRLLLKAISSLAKKASFLAIHLSACSQSRLNNFRGQKRHYNNSFCVNPNDVPVGQDTDPKAASSASMLCTSDHHDYDLIVLYIMFSTQCLQHSPVNGWYVTRYSLNFFFDHTSCIVAL